MESRHLGAIFSVIALSFICFGLGLYSAEMQLSKVFIFKDWLPFLGTIPSIVIAFNANNIAKRNAASQLRPHVYISNNKIYDIEGVLYIGCEFKNYGLSPALDVNIDFQFVIAPISGSIEERDMIRFVTGGAIAPGGISTVDRPMNILSKENIPAIRSGELGIFMRSIISYTWRGANGERDGLDVTSVCDADYLERGLFRNIQR